MSHKSFFCFGPTYNGRPTSLTKPPNPWQIYFEKIRLAPLIAFFPQFPKPFHSSLHSGTKFPRLLDTEFLRDVAGGDHHRHPLQITGEVPSAVQVRIKAMARFNWQSKFY